MTTRLSTRESGGERNILHVDALYPSEETCSKYTNADSEHIYQAFIKTGLVDAHMRTESPNTGCSSRDAAIDSSHPPKVPERGLRYFR
jgi:hypothetical protein